MKQNCVVLEIENVDHFQYQLNKYLLDGYKIESSSCNGKYYRAILVLDLEETEKDVDADFVKKIENDTETALLDAIEKELLDVRDKVINSYRNSDEITRFTVRSIFDTCYSKVHKFRKDKISD
jgi:hypothetical protein